MFKYPCGSLCIDLWEAPAKYGLQWKMMQVSRIQWAWQHLIQALILCGVKQHSQVYRCGHSNSHEWRWRWHFFFVVMHWMSMFRWEGRRARDENTVRVKDGERKEGWRELGEILERTEGRLYSYHLSCLFYKTAEFCERLFMSLSLSSSLFYPQLVLHMESLH